jgi:simple sugar transport system permease protein
MSGILDFLSSASPLVLASLGALLTELAGVLGIFIEGFMNLGAFFSWILAGALAPAWGTNAVFAAAGIAALAAAAFCGIFARLVRKSGANPFIAGLALNIAAGGATAALSVLWFGTKGVLRTQFLSGASRPPWVALAACALVLAALYVNHSPWGLRLRASGLAPEAAKERGIRPGRYWELSWALAAFLAALAGAALCFRIGAYTPGGASGRGWLALAAVYLGFRRPLGVFAAACAFALADRAGFMLQGLSSSASTLLLGIPNALALVLYTASCALRVSSRKTAC